MVYYNTHGLLQHTWSITTHMVYYNTHGHQATKPKRQLGAMESTQHQPAPTARAKKPTSTLIRTTVVRGFGQAGPEACPTRPSQHPKRRPIQEIITPHQSNTQFAQVTINKQGPRNAPRARSLYVYGLRVYAVDLSVYRDPRAAGALLENTCNATRAASYVYRAGRGYKSTCSEKGTVVC
jgi:hypothetical protein